MKHSVICKLQSNKQTFILKFSNMEISVLKNVFIFSELSAEELELIRKFSRIKSYSKGDIIFFDTEPYIGFCVVLEGMVKIYKISGDGREHIIHLVDKYNTCAEVPLFENSGAVLEKDFRYPANAMAMADNTEVIIVPARPFIELINNNPSLAMKMISGFAKRLRHLNKHIESITLKDVSRRVAEFILNEYYTRLKSTKKSSLPPETIRLKISKYDLASYLGTILETLSRTFKKLQDEGIIEVEGRLITVKDSARLKEAAS
jgi:CRP/FNR family transcriptional regulator, dissimilatory nitrate respiration regulator